MSNLYGKTTESLESLDNVTCTTKFKTCNSPTSDSSNKSPKAPPVTPMEMKKIQPNIDQQDYDQASVGFSSGTLDGYDPYSSNPDVYSQNQPGKPKLTRAKSIKQSIAHNTLDFFGVADEIVTRNRKQKWDQRRIRHLSRYGKIKESISSATTPDLTDGGGHRGFASVVMQTIQQQNLQQQQSTVSTKSTRKQNAAALLWKTAQRHLSARPQYEVSTIQSYGGRSFAPADLMDEDISVFGSSLHLDERASRSITPTPLPTPSMVDDRSFFQFYPSTIEEENSFDITDGGSSRRSDGFHIDRGLHPRQVEPCFPPTPPSPSAKIVSSWDNNLGPEPMITQAGKPKLRPDYTRQPSERRQRLQTTLIRPVKKLKRELGKGLVGNLFNRTFRRRIDSNIRKQIDEIPDHRPYFTYWLSFVQLVILIVMVSVYPFAPVGVSQKQIKEDLFARQLLSARICSISTLHPLH